MVEVIAQNEKTGIKLVELGDGSGEVMIYRNGIPVWALLKENIEENRTMYRYGRSRVMHFKQYCAAPNTDREPVEIKYVEGVLLGLSPCQNCHERQWRPRYEKQG